jgi:hypothetical protein
MEFGPFMPYSHVRVHGTIVQSGSIAYYIGLVERDLAGIPAYRPAHYAQSRAAFINPN